LEGSVRQQLIADVPVGVLLSGGIDSSLITAVVAKVSQNKVKTFTVTFPDNRSFDESRYARLIAKHFGTEHIELEAPTASYEILPDLAAQFDDPIADSSMVPTYLISKLVRKHVKVVLGGDGADELFGGYLHYSWLFSFIAFRKFLPGFPRRIISVFSDSFLPIGMRGRSFLSNLQKDAPECYFFANKYFDTELRCQILRHFAAKSDTLVRTPNDYKTSLYDGSKTPLRNIMGIDFQTYLADDILTKIDRASMLASLETRAPWLDRKIIEFAYGMVPEHLKVNKEERKILPKRLARKMLPEQFDIKRKQGFVLPLDAWIKEGCGGFIRDVLLSESQRVFDHGMIKTLLKNNGMWFSNGERLFALTMFELWRREYKIALP
jgi:asparagine synthase (glutamine-hydrolysing)